MSRVISHGLRPASCTALHSAVSPGSAATVVAHVEVQGQQHLLPVRGAHGEGGEFGVQTGGVARGGQYVTAFGAGEHLQRDDRAGRQVHDGSVRESEPVPPGRHGSSMPPPGRRPCPVHALFTQDSGAWEAVTARRGAAHAPAGRQRPCPASQSAAMRPSSASRPASIMRIIRASPRSDHAGCPNVAGLFRSMRKCAGQAVP